MSLVREFCMVNDILGNESNILCLTAHILRNLYMWEIECNQGS